MAIKIFFILFLVFLALRKFILPFAGISKNISSKQKPESTHASPAGTPKPSNTKSQKEEGEYIDFEEIK